MTTEAKVGAFTVVGFAFLTYIIIHLSGMGFGDKGYPVHVLFNEVNGLKPGNLVRYAGVDIGKVDDVHVEPDGAKVRLLINSGVKIPDTAIVGIGADGLMGEKYISISPGAETNGFLKAGDAINGKDQQGLDRLLVTADSVLLDIQKLVQSLNNVFGDERVQNALIDSAVSVKELTENLNRMSAVMARMAINNEQDVKAMVTNLKFMSGSMMNAAGRVEHMLATLDNNGQTATDLREAIANLNATSKRVENMAVSIEGVVTDPETAENLKATLRNARGVSEKANRMMNQVSNIKTETSAEVLYSAGSKEYKTNADIRINTSPNDFLLLGINDIGEGNKANVQVGSGNDKFASRVGLIDSKAGVGLDAKINNEFRMSVDAYDPNDLRVKLRAQYEVAPETFIVGETDSINKSQNRESYVGMRHSF